MAPRQRCSRKTQLDDEAAAARRTRTCPHLADLREAGYLVAAGPLLGPPDREFRGLSILKVDPERALELKQEDPAVRAGRFAVKVFPWIVPGGAMSFSPTRFSRSVADTESD